jgi:hypothetical protein
MEGATSAGTGAAEGMVVALAADLTGRGPLGLRQVGLLLAPPARRDGSFVPGSHSPRPIRSRSAARMRRSRGSSR